VVPPIRVPGLVDLDKLPRWLPSLLLRSMANKYSHRAAWLMWQPAARDGSFTTELTPGPTTRLVARDLPGPSLEPIQGLWRNCALDVWTGRKAEPEELPILRSCHRALRLIDLRPAA
jgi:hypothetical protein